jgi:hypothetical protein
MQPDGSQMTQITLAPIPMNRIPWMTARRVHPLGPRLRNLSTPTAADNIDNPNFSTHPHGGGFGHSNGDGFPPGLDKPKDWTTDDKCGASVARPDGTRVFIQDVLNLYRIAPSGGNLHRYFGSINAAVTDASFIHFMDPIPMDDGNLITIMRHIYNPVYGGDVVKINSKNFYAVGKPIDASVSGEAEQSMTPGLVNFYPNQVSPAGWYSAVFPYHDGSDRLLASWAQCLVRSGEVDAVCQGSSTSDDLLPPQYGIWSVDPAKNTRLPVVKGITRRLIPISIGSYNRTRNRIRVRRPIFSCPGFGVFHIRSVYDRDGDDMTDVSNGGPYYVPTRTKRYLDHARSSVTRPDDRSERFVRVLEGEACPANWTENPGQPDTQPDRRQRAADGAASGAGLRGS